MRLLKHPSLVVADKVLAELRRILTGKGGSTLDIRCYANTREQGYHIAGPTSHPVAVSFCQDSNSDCICVWYGPSQYFSGDGVITDGPYANVFFYPGQYKQAARWIATYLLTKVVLPVPE